MKKVFMIGDSLMQDYNALSYPQYGYGTLLKNFLKDEVTLINLAKAGTSTKSFIDQNRFDDVINSIQKDDLLIIEFGNNDEKEEDPLRYTNKDKEFLENLGYFISIAKSKGAKSFLMTSPTRHNFIDGKILDNHKGYPEAMVKYAKENNIYIIDLNEITKELYNEIGEEETKKFHLIFNKNIYLRYKDGSDDHSHYTYKGALFIASIIINELERTYEYFNDYFIKYSDAIMYNKELRLE